MTVQELKNRVKDEFESMFDSDFKKAIKNAVDTKDVGEIYEAVSEATEINIYEISEGGEYRTMASYFDMTIGLEIILDSQYYMGESYSDFFIKLLELVKEKQKVETKIKGTK